MVIVKQVGDENFLAQRCLVTQISVLSVKVIKKRTFRPSHSSIPSTCQFCKEYPSEPTKTLCEQKAARTDSLAIEEMIVLVSSHPPKRSAARFQGSEGRKRLVSKNASRFRFRFLSFPVSPPIPVDRKRDGIFWFSQPASRPLEPSSRASKRWKPMCP